jgi:hypothetical protein
VVSDCHAPGNLLLGFYPISAACWQPYFKAHTMMVNGNYNGWRLEDAWFER